MVGNSLNYRPDELNGASDIRGVFKGSSRGPAADKRILPNIVAPGTDIVSTRAISGSEINGVETPGNPYTDTANLEHPRYTTRTGSSMAAPHVAGLCALLIQWWRRKTGAHPSQALLKAMLINGG